VKRFLVCIHDATPAFARETRVMLRDLAPLVGSRLSVAVVPDWHGEWPLASYPEYCRLVKKSAGEILLHGYHHRRLRGVGPIALLTANGDEMNGLDPAGTQRALDRGQRVFAEAFGEPARGFLAPAWQRGHVGLDTCGRAGLDHMIGFFSLESRGGRHVPLATYTWDCGRWSWLGRVGHQLGRLRDSPDRRVPTLAAHPRDVSRGFWPGVLRLTRDLLAAGHEPCTPATLLEAHDAVVDS